MMKGDLSKTWYFHFTALIAPAQLPAALNNGSFKNNVDLGPA